MLANRAHQLESRMRETRPSGSEGGARSIPRPYPYRRRSTMVVVARCTQSSADYTVRQFCKGCVTAL
jgi:hypothetical protein